MKKDRFSSFLLLVLICLVGYNLFTMKQIKTDVESYNQKIDSIQNDIDSVILVNEQLDAHIDQIHKNVTILDNNIDNVQTNIKTIKTKTNEKVDAVNEFTFSDLSKFFSDRYEGNSKN